MVQEGRRDLDDTLGELSDEQLQDMSELVRFHTPTRQETKDRIKDHVLDKLRIQPRGNRAARKVEKDRPFEEYEPEELMLRLLQEADKLGLPRGHYSRKPDSPRRTPFAMLTSVAREAKSRTPIMKGRPSSIEQGLRFSVSKELGLYGLADDLARMSRRDPEIDQEYADVSHRQGAALEAGEKLGILKP